MDRTLVEFFYRLWFRCEVEGIENVPAEGGALLVSNHSGALPPDAPMIAKAIKEEHPHPRPLYLTVEHFFKGYPGFSMLLPKIGARARPPGERPPPALRRAAARARLPRGPQGDREALQGPLPAAALRPRRLRRGGDARPRADRPHRRGRGRGGRAGLRPGQAAAAADRPALLPDHADLPALRPARDARLPAGQVQAPLPARRCRPTIPPSATSRGRTRRSCRPSPTRSAPRSRHELVDMLGRAAQRLVRDDAPSGSCSPGLSTYWGGRLAQALERDPAVEAIIGVDRRPPKVELHRTEYVRVDRLALAHPPHRGGGRDRHGGRHAPGRRLDRHQPAAGPREQRRWAR